MSIKILKQFGKKSESAPVSVADRVRARREARKAAEALVAARKAAIAKKNEEEGEGDQVDDINLDADTATVVFADKDANIQVVVGEDPVDGGITVAVATAEKGNLEEEEVLASVTVGEGDEPSEEGASDPEGKTETESESKKAAEIEEARQAIKLRLQR